jgi:hypothetical protein
MIDDDMAKLARAWHAIRSRDRAVIKLETASMIFRYANYGICVSRDPPAPDPRQTSLDLVGGSHRARAVKVLVT